MILLLRRFVAEIVACHHSKAKAFSRLFVHDDYWNYVESYAPRLIESVILKAGEKEHVMEDLRRFRASRQRYRRLGVPYHRGYLFYGPPGTGKTSLVSGLGAIFGMSIYVLNLTEMNDRSLKSAMGEVPEGSIVLFEDIDCMKAGNRRTESKPTSSQGEKDGEMERASSRVAVTLSGLLNVLDGFYAPDNVVFVMTTNDIDALDPALMRPGRIDYRLYLGAAEHSQKIELYRRFFPDANRAEANDFVDCHNSQTMAEFQGELLALEQNSERAGGCSSNAEEPVGSR